MASPWNAPQTLAPKREIQLAGEVVAPGYTSLLQASVSLPNNEPQATETRCYEGPGVVQAPVAKAAVQHPGARPHRTVVRTSRTGWTPIRASSEAV